MKYVHILNNRAGKGTAWLWLLFLMLTCHVEGMAQRHEIYKDHIRSLKVIANNDWMSLPICELGKCSFSISFDDLTPEYHRYMYKVEHCEADWSVSTELFPTDYIAGFDTGNVIDDIQESLLTTTLYTHYQFSIPNENCRLTMSGNYKVTVYDDNNNEEPVLTVCLMVVEPLMGLGMVASTNTDIDINNTHQQLSMELNYGNLLVVNPQQQLKTVVMQNKRWDNARWNVQPQYVLSDRLRWEHCRELIFEGGNEYHKFEILSTNVASMGIESLSWDGKRFHAYPYVPEPRRNYLYDEDANGAYVFRNSDNYESTFTSDYIDVHFHLLADEKLNGEVYVNGDWTFDRFLPQYRMQYDEVSKSYEAVLPLKLGYYSYQFLLVGADGRVGFVPSEGNFYQTENEYQALVYYREQGGRTDRLVAYQHISTRPRSRK